MENGVQVPTEAKHATDLLSDNEEQEEPIVIDDDSVGEDEKNTGFDDGKATPTNGRKRPRAEGPICDFERSFFVKKVAPDIPYEFMTFIAFKNSNWACLKLAQVCGFIEEVFEYFTGRDPSWHETVFASLNSPTFVKSPGRTMANTTYTIHYAKKKTMEEAIDKWRKKINEDNVHMHGFNSMEAFESVVDGEQCRYFTDPETYRREKNEMRRFIIKKRLEAEMEEEDEVTPESRTQFIKFNQPNIPSKFLTFIVFKNSNFSSLQLHDVCSFLGTVFPYYSRNKSVWRNKVMASVYNNHTFLKVPNKSNSRFSYSVNPYRAKEMEDKISEWRKNVNERNVYTYGFETMEAFDSVFDGEHSFFFENPEAYCRQSGLDPPEKEGSASPIPEDTIDDCIDSVVKRMSGGKRKAEKKKEKAVMKAVEEAIKIPAYSKTDDRFILPNASDPFHAVAVSAAQDVMFSRVHDGVRPVTDEDLEMFDFLDTGVIAQQVNEYLVLTGFSIRSFCKDVLGVCPILKQMLDRPAPWENCSRSVRTWFIQMKLFLEDVEQAVQESKEAIMQEEGQDMDNAMSQVKDEDSEREREIDLELISKEEPGTSSASNTYTMVSSSNEETLVTFDGLEEEDGGVVENEEGSWNHLVVGPSTSTAMAQGVPPIKDYDQETMKFWQAADIYNLTNIFEVNATFPDDIHAAVTLQKAGILPSQLYCSKCGGAMTIAGRSMPLWVCPSCTHLVSVTDNSFFKSPKVALRQIWIILLAWVQDATVDFVISTFTIPKHVVLHYYSAFRRLCDRICDKYPQFGGKGCTVHVDSNFMLNRVRVISGIDAANQKCFATMWDTSDDIPYAVRRHVKMGSTLLVTDRKVNWATQFAHVNHTNRRSPVTPVLQRVETTMTAMGAPPLDHVLRGFISEVVVRYCEGPNLYKKLVQTLREYVPDRLRVPHRLCPAGILLPENGNSKGMKVVYDPARY